MIFRQELLDALLQPLDKYNPKRNYETKNGAITSSRIVDVDKRKCRAQFPPVETTTFGV
jgi:hypothetical protein